jgi:hypothetical protein
MITRRNALAGLLAMPSALNAVALAAGDQPILGPTVFAWEDMKPVKNAGWRSQIALQKPDCDAGSTGDARDHFESGPRIASAAPPCE